MNRLQYETSPYLLQHKDNPVDWFTWGDEAIEKARQQDKPILVSIGYSACHWCHVMEHESFENPQVAELMNSNFINIKVDREEHPDIDNIYMNFVQLTTGSGGWPLTVFLTPELVPFFGGTYFPVNDQYGRPGFLKILNSIADLYNNRKDEILKQKDDIIKALNSMGEIQGNQTDFTLPDFNKAFSSILRNYDEEWGGFGNSPKFPASMTLMFLMRYYSQTGNSVALEIVENSLEKMAHGGIYDQIGGGFHRYSTDNEWLIPHFEKMLYDNALLSRTYLEAFQLTGNKFFLGIAEDILNYVGREMTDQTGGFYSSQDADSEGKEGLFFTWSLDELKNFLNDSELKIAKEWYGLTQQGNFEGKNILTTRRKTDELAQKLGMRPTGLMKDVQSIREKIYLQREKRLHPGLDDKILTSWNALMLYSFALAYGITGRESYKITALKTADFLWNKRFKNSTLFHTVKSAKSSIDGYLDDYSLLSEAYIKLYEVTSDEKWIFRADRLIEVMIEKFYDKNSSGFYYTSENSRNLIVRTRDIYDNSLPGGNSSAVNALLQMSVFLNKPDYYLIASKVISRMHDIMLKYPEGFSYIFSAAFSRSLSLKEVSVVVSDAGEILNIRKAYFNEFFPAAVFASVVAGDTSEMEILKGKEALNERTTYYLCQNYTCKAPVFSFEELKEELNSAKNS